MFALTFKENLQKILRMDFLILFLQAALLCIGVFFIRNAGREYGGPPSHRWLMQLFWAGLGLFLYLFFALADYRKLAKFSPWFYAGGMLLLLWVLVAGAKVNGARCVLKLTEGFALQISEITKPIVLLFCAWALSHPVLAYVKIPRALVWLGIMGVPFLLILLEPDCGTALVYLPFTLAILYLVHLSWKNVGVFLLLGVLLLPACYLCLKPYQKLRIFVFAGKPLEGMTRMVAVFSPSAADGVRQWIVREMEKLGEKRGYLPDQAEKPAGTLKKGAALPEIQAKVTRELDDWNARQALMTIGSGGKLGLGYGKGIQHTLGYLPRYVAPTDFIFSVIAEESGFFGATFVLLLLFLLIFQTCRTAFLASDSLGLCIAGGAAVLYATHIFTNIGMNVGWMPIIGIPLPFLSYGGSYLLGTMAVAGMVQSVHVHRRIRKETA